MNLRIRRMIFRITLSAIGSSLIIPTPLFGSLPAEAAPTFSTLKSVDAMKYTKDVMANQPSDAEINNLVATLGTLPITHIGISIPMDASADYPANSKPYPRDSYAFTQAWADAIHAKGLHIIWRGTWSGIEGIYSFPRLVGSSRFPTGTAQSAASDGNSTWLGKTYGYIINHPTFFADGDIWAPLPERTEGIFQDSTSFLPYSSPGIQANYVNFFNDLKLASDNAFARIGKGVITGMSSNNYTEVLSGWLAQSLFDNNGVVTIDYYGNNHTPGEMDTDLRAMANLHHHPIYLQEWADYWNDDSNPDQRTQYLQSMYAEMEQLVKEGVLVGFNYWGGWSNVNEGILTKDSSGFHLNYKGNLLANFFGADASITSTSPSVSSVCPNPGSNAFTGCYYSDQTLNNLAAVRTDSAINFDWGTGSPDPKIPVDHFSARWQGAFSFNAGDYIFSMTSDDGARLYVDGQLVLDKWVDQPATTVATSVNLNTGTHLVRMEYYEDNGGAVAKLNWNQSISSITKKRRK